MPTRRSWCSSRPASRLTSPTSCSPIGPADLSISFGAPGQFDHPILVDAIQRFIEQCDRRGVVPGIHCRNAEQARIWARRGMRFVGAGGEHGLLLEKAREVMAGLNSQAATQSSKNSR